jgi:hypothetical protein
MPAPKISDTTPDAAAAQLAILQAMSPSRRAELAMEFTDQMHDTLRAGIRARHPEYSDRQVILAAAKIVLGPELFAEAFAAEADLVS